MELSSFKAVLLRKAQGNNGLQNFIKSVDDDRFADVVIEVLEKMPRATAGTGTRANGAITSFGARAGVTEINMMRDALGHHLSHYKAALKAHHAAPENSPEKNKMRQVADAHMDHLFPLMHLAARTASHSQENPNTFDFDYPKIAPWETNYTTLTRNSKNNGPLRDPKLLRVRTKNSGSISKNTKDWGFLEMPPHPGHPDNATMPHTSGYPWEEIQLGTSANIDNKKAHLHIEDLPAKGEFTPHEFDSHPIRGMQDAQSDHLSPERLSQYKTDAENWHNSEHVENWLKRMESLQPGEFEARGHLQEIFDENGKIDLKQDGKKHNHLYDGVPLRPHEDHVKNHPVVSRMASTPVPAAHLVVPAARMAVKPTVRPAQATATQAQSAPSAASSAATNPTASPPVQPTASPTPSIKTGQKQAEDTAAWEALQNAPQEVRAQLLQNPEIQRLLFRIMDKKGK